LSDGFLCESRAKWDYIMSEKIITNSITTKDLASILPYHKRIFDFKHGVSHILPSICSSFSNEDGWGFYSLSNGGFYMKPLSDKCFHISGKINSYDSYKGEVTADAFGVILSLLSINSLIFYAYGSVQEEAALIEKYCQLKDYTYQHAERKKILSYID
jgi:hypothetical protein